jgi:hypothetical protein
MRHRILSKLLLVPLMLLPLTSANGCGFFIGLFTSEEVSLEYVGEIKFQAPVTEGQFTRIPISFSGGKWLENSGITFKKVKASRYGSEIRITVVTCLAGSGNEIPKPEIELKGLVPGKYQIIYINPDGSSMQLKQIEI